MKKQAKIFVSLAIIVLILLGAIIYWKYSFNNHDVVENGNQNTNIDNINQQNTGDIDTNNWSTFEDKKLGFSFKYPADKYEVESSVLQNSMIVVDTIKNKEDGQNVVRFYSHKSGYDIARSLFFGDVAGYTIIDGKYYMVYFNDRKEVSVIDKLSNVIGDIIIIDGTKFDYSGPSIGPGSKYAAIVNLSDNKYSGIAILPNDKLVSYDEFLAILKSIHKIDVDTSDWSTFEDKKLNFSFKYPSDKYDIKTNLATEVIYLADILISKIENKSAMAFYSHFVNYSNLPRASFEKIGGYYLEDGTYKIFYGIKEDGYKTENVKLLDTVDSDFGKIIIIDGTQFDYSKPNFGPGGSYAAVMNLPYYAYSGVAIWANDKVLPYDEFLAILKSIHKIDVDTSDWSTFEDKELGVSYKYPKGCDWIGAGPGSRATNMIRCYYSYMLYEPLNFSYSQRSDFKNLSIKEIAEIYYNLNKQNSQNEASQRFISNLEQRDINGYEAYQFVADKFFDAPCLEDHLKTCIGTSLEDHTNVFIFISDGQKKMLIRIPNSDPISAKILSTLTFVN